jgi:hypothetical protein
MRSLPLMEDSFSSPLHSFVGTKQQRTLNYMDQPNDNEEDEDPMDHWNHIIIVVGGDRDDTATTNNDESMNHFDFEVLNQMTRFAKQIRKWRPSPDNT